MICSKNFFILFGDRYPRQIEAWNFCLAWEGVKSTLAPKQLYGDSLLDWKVSTMSLEQSSPTCFVCLLIAVHVSWGREEDGFAKSLVSFRKVSSYLESTDDTTKISIALRVTSAQPLIVTNEGGEATPHPHGIWEFRIGWWSVEFAWNQPVKDYLHM